VRHAVAGDQHLDALVDVVDGDVRDMVIHRVADEGVFESVSQEGFWVNLAESLKQFLIHSLSSTMPLIHSRYRLIRV
jgi:hypothetical protein